MSLFSSAKWWCYLFHITHSTCPCLKSPGTSSSCDRSPERVSVKGFQTVSVQSWFLITGFPLLLRCPLSSLCSPKLASKRWAHRLSNNRSWLDDVILSQSAPCLTSTRADASPLYQRALQQQRWSCGRLSATSPVWGKQNVDHHLTVSSTPLDTHVQILEDSWTFHHVHSSLGIIQ